jgi:hypothetical protein
MRPLKGKRVLTAMARSMIKFLKRQGQFNTRIRRRSPAGSRRAGRSRCTSRTATASCRASTRGRHVGAGARRSPGRPSPRGGRRCPAARGGCGRARGVGPGNQHGPDGDAALGEPCLRLLDRRAHELVHAPASRANDGDRLVGSVPQGRRAPRVVAWSESSLAEPSMPVPDRRQLTAVGTARVDRGSGSGPGCPRCVAADRVRPRAVAYRATESCSRGR